MNASRLLPLAVLAVMALGLATWASIERQPGLESGTRAELLPGLAGRLNSIERVRLVGAGESTLATIERRDDQWVLLERGGYPVDSGKLRGLLLALSQARTVEPKTANPERHDRLGVEDVAADDATGVRVELEGGGEPLRVIVGDSRLEAGSYVRRADEAQSWLIDRELRVEKQPQAWLLDALANIPVERIVRVEVQPEQGGRITIGRADDAAGDFRLLDLPKGREPASEFIADATAGLLSSLNFDDVMAADAIDAPDTTRHSTFLTREGLSIAIDSWQLDGKTYARFDASIDDAQADRWIAQQQAQATAQWNAKQSAADAPAKPSEAAAADGNAAAPDDADRATAAVDGVEASAEASVDATSDRDVELAPAAPLAVTDPAADHEQRLAGLRDEVEALDVRFADRLFVLPDFKAANLNRDLDAYLKPKG